MTDQGGYPQPDEQDQSGPTPGQPAQAGSPPGQPAQAGSPPGQPTPAAPPPPQPWQPPGQPLQPQQPWPPPDQAHQPYQGWPPPDQPYQGWPPPGQAYQPWPPPGQAYQPGRPAGPPPLWPPPPPAPPVHYSLDGLAAALTLLLAASVVSNIAAIAVPTMRIAAQLLYLTLVFLVWFFRARKNADGRGQNDGVAYSDSQYTFYSVTPHGRSDWDSGDRLLTCVVYLWAPGKPRRKPLYTSIKSSYG
jgi:hypothetical protein